MCYQPIQVKNPKYGLPEQPQYLMVNCRKCLECRQKRANEWAVRCMLEAKKYQANCFITLTYENNPIWLRKRDLQLFFKRFRKAVYPLKVKFFAVGEYGSLHHRPHYHALIFGYDFQDKYLWSKSKRGNVIYRSALLEKLWTYGNSTVQELNYQTCAYSALYSSPQVHEMPVYLRTVPEFNLMSKNLGTDLLMQNMEQYLRCDEIYISGHKVAIPQYALNKYFGDIGKLTDSRYLALKLERKKKYDVSYEWFNDYTAEQLWQTPLSQRKIIAENARKRLTNSL